MPSPAIFYVDGFNLDNGLYKGKLPSCPPTTKWLDLSSLCVALGSGYEVVVVKLFTARVKNDQRDPGQRARQQVFWDALRTRTGPVIQIIEGRFAEVHKTGLVKYPLDSGATVGAFVRIETREEKGTDVNLAVHLVADAFQRRMDAAFVISNDTDLVGAIQIVQADTGRDVHVIIPTQRNSANLQRLATTYTALDPSLVADHQMPARIVTPTGRVLTSPIAWS